MEYSLVVTHMFLSGFLFFILNWIGGHSIHAGYIRMSVLAKADEAPAFNFLYRAFSPVAYIVVVSAIVYQLKLDWVVQDIYLVVVYHFFLRLAFNVVTGRGRLLNWTTQGAYFFVSVPVSYYVYSNLIVHKEFLFPTAEELGGAVWLAVVAYIYHTFNNIRLSDEKTKSRKKNYLRNRYLIYKNRYGEIIESASDYKTQEILIYAVLIIEAFNRPRVYRLVENFLFCIGMAKTLGVMQVTTTHYINDGQSVFLGAKKIVNDHVEAQVIVDGRGYDGGLRSVMVEVIKLYNPDLEYVYEVCDLYDEIKSMFYPDLVDEYGC